MFWLVHFFFLVDRINDRVWRPSKTRCGRRSRESIKYNGRLQEIAVSDAYDFNTQPVFTHNDWEKFQILLISSKLSLELIR